MKKIVLAMAVLALMVGSGTTARATLVTFDDLTRNDSPIPNGYGGLNWNNFYVLDGVNYSGNPSGYQNGVVSPNNVAYNGFGNPADALSVDSVTPFTFNSAYLTAAWRDGLQVTITGYLLGVQEDQTTVTVNTSGPSLITLNWTGIDDLNFNSFGGVPHGYSGGNGTQFAMDNFLYNAPVTAVPEPSTFVIGLGCLGFVGYALRRRRNAVAA